MNANNKKIFIVSFILISFLFTCNVSAYSIGRTTDSSGSSKSVAGAYYVPYKNYTDEYGTRLVYCSQPNMPAPRECASWWQIPNELAAGITQILDSGLPYICKERVLTNFIYNYGNWDNYTYARDYVDWSSICGDNFNVVYNNAVNAYDFVKNTRKITYNTSTLNFKKNGDVFVAETKVTVPFWNPNIWNCSVSDSYTTIAYSGANYEKITITTPINNPNKEIKLTCWVDFPYKISWMAYDCKGYNANGAYVDAQELISLWGPTSTKNTSSISGTIPSKGKIKLKKVITGTDTLITSGEVTVGLYSDSECSSDKKLSEYKFRGQLSTSIELEPGIYYFKEIESPGESYTVDNTCHRKDIDYGDEIELKIENTSECIVDVLNNLLGEGKNFNDKTQRIALYEKYLTKGNNYTNFLDFNATYIKENNLTNEEKAALTCSQAKCNKPISDKSCLNVKSSSGINDNNWACYTDNITDVNGNKGYCSTEFNFKNNETDIKLTKLSNHYLLGKAKAGQFIFKTDKIGTGSINQTCYFNDEINANSINIKSYSDYIGNISFNKQILKSKIKNNETDLIKLSDEKSGKFTGKVEVDYYIDEVMVEPISGKPCSNDSSCISIGAGLISEFQDGKTNQIEGKNYAVIDGEKYPIVPFKVEINNSVFGTDSIELDESNESVCIYSVEPEIIKYGDKDTGKIDLEFRSIDTNKPFTRDTNSNWCDESDCKEDNTTVTTYISNRNNSYNKNKQNVLYTNSTNSDKKRIILTPEIIKEIREWNNSHKYDNFELDCDENGNCENAFLKKFKIVKVKVKDS